MAAGDTPITVVGNLVADPELRFTASGQPVATFRIASTPRIRDNATNEWKDGDSLFLTCNVWRQAAENVAESLQRGMRVIVNGRLKQRQYETKHQADHHRNRGQPERRVPHHAPEIGATQHIHIVRHADITAALAQLQQA